MEFHQSLFPLFIDISVHFQELPITTTQMKTHLLFPYISRSALREQNNLVFPPILSSTNPNFVSSIDPPKSKLIHPQHLQNHTTLLQLDLATLPSYRYYDPPYYHTKTLAGFKSLCNTFLLSRYLIPSHICTAICIVCPLVNVTLSVCSNWSNAPLVTSSVTIPQSTSVSK
jgi:hypothetical protein